MKSRVAMIAILFALGCSIIALYAWSFSREFVTASDGWSDRSDAIELLVFEDSSFPISAKKVRYHQVVRALRGYELHFACDGAIEDLNTFAKQSLQPFANDLKSAVLSKSLPAGDFDTAISGWSRFGWMSPSRDSQCVLYYCEEYRGPTIVVDQTNAMLYYHFSD